jgi:hypothetical protein
VPGAVASQVGRWARGGPQAGSARHDRLLSDERDIIRTEARFYGLAAPTGVPFPARLHADLDGPIQYLIMSAIDGVPWYGADESLPAADRPCLRRDGYPQ